MATVLEEQEAMQQDNTLMDRPLKKIQHVQQANLCLPMSKEHVYAKIKLPTNFAGVENLSDLTKRLYEELGWESFMREGGIDVCVIFTA